MKTHTMPEGPDLPSSAAPAASFNHAMKTIILLAFIVCPTLCHGAMKAPPSADHYFAHPGARIIAKWKNGECTAELTQTRNAHALDPKHPESTFRGGCGHDDDGIFWEFVHKTEHGDVYLIKRGRPVREQVITPILFRGKEQTVIATPDLTVQILPATPKTTK